MRSLWAFAARITTTMHISTGRFESTQSMHLFARLADPSGKARSEAANLCLFICLFVSIKPEKSYSASCVKRGSKPPGSDHTRAEAQATCLPKTAACFRVPMRTRTNGFAFKKIYLRVHSPREIALLLATNSGCAVKYVSQKWNESRWYNILDIFMLRFNCTSILY